MTLAPAVRAAFASALLATVVPGSFTPARYRSGPAPPTAVRAVTGGEVLVELDVDDRGSVASTSPLRVTPPFTDDVMAAVRAWTFTPATQKVKPDTRESADAAVTPLRSKVLVAAIFRPPTIDTPTLGEPPKNVAVPSTEVAFPISIVPPAYPPNVLFDGTVLLECRVGADGRLRDVTVLQSAGPFDRPAIEAVRRWTFRPAAREGQPVDAFVYASLAFRQPVTGR